MLVSETESVIREPLNRVRRNSLHSISPVSEGAGEIPYPLLPSSFPL